jgi:hypothetical protein
MNQPVTKKQCTTRREQYQDRQNKAALAAEDSNIDPATIDIFKTYKCWRAVPFELQCIVKNARAALKRQWIHELEDAPLAVQQDKDFIRECIIRSMREYDMYCKPVKRRYKRKRPIKLHKSDWNDLPEEWKLDWELAAAALHHYRAYWKDIPESLRSQDDFMKKAVAAQPYILPEMPDHIRNDKEYWLSDQVEYEDTLFRQLLETHPDLRENRQFWLKVVRSEDAATQVPLLEEFASPSIYQDREIMFIACTQNSPYFLSDLVPPLSQDEEFLRQVCQVIGGVSFRMRHFPSRLLRLFPHILTDIVLPKYKDCEDLYYAIHPDLWNDVKVVKVWLQHGGSYPKKESPNAWKSDPDLFLWIAKHCPISNRLQSFQCSTEILRSDKSFMLNALNLDPLLFRAATPELHNNIDLQMLVYSQFFENDELEKLGIDHMARQRILDYAQENMKAHDGFMSFLYCVKCGMTSEKPIALLNQGPTTSMAYYNLVAEYLEVPTGLKLKHVRQCMDQFRRMDAS